MEKLVFDHVLPELKKSKKKSGHFRLHRSRYGVRKGGEFFFYRGKLTSDGLPQCSKWALRASAVPQIPAPLLQQALDGTMTSGCSGRHKRASQDGAMTRRLLQTPGVIDYLLHDVLLNVNNLKNAQPIIRAISQGLEYHNIAKSLQYLTLDNGPGWFHLDSVAPILYVLADQPSCGLRDLRLVGCCKDIERRLSEHEYRKRLNKVLDALTLFIDAASTSLQILRLESFFTVLPQALVDAIVRSQTLEELYVRDCKEGTGQILQTFAESTNQPHDLTGNPMSSIRHFSFERAQDIDAKQISVLLKTSGNMVSLDLTRSCNSIEIVKALGNNLKSSDSRLRNLVLEEGLTTEGVKIIADALIVNKSLRRLSIHGTHRDREGADLSDLLALGQALSKNTTLQFLGLCNIPLGYDDAMMSLIDHNIALRRISLDPSFKVQAAIDELSAFLDERGASLDSRGRNPRRDRLKKWQNFLSYVEKRNTRLFCDGLGFVSMEAGLCAHAMCCSSVRDWDEKSSRYAIVRMAVSTILGCKKL